MRKIINFAVITALSLVFNACGSGGKEGSMPSATSVNTGVFIDSPVEGLKYETMSLSGYTNNKGQFQYRAGETIKFYLGNLELGTTSGRSTITPLTLNMENDLNNIGNKAANLARLLQTLDNNSSNGAILVIPSTLKDLNIIGLNIDSDADLNTILAQAEIKTGINYILKDTTSAKAEMKKQIDVDSLYPLINTLKHSATGTKYYLLRLTEESNVLINQSGRDRFEATLAEVGDYRITIYDLNLNVITKHNAKLHAGTYIVKVQHDYAEDSTFLINYPLLTNQTTHTKLKNGTFSSVGAKYYSLHMPSNAKVDFTYAGSAGENYPAYIYDTNLSLISHIGGIMSLNAGDYVIFFDHGPTNRTPRPLTVSSTVLP